MEILSDRLSFSKLIPSEIDNYLSWYTNDRVTKFIFGKGLSDEAARRRFETALDINSRHPKLGFYSVKLRTNKQFIGIAKLVLLKPNQAEVGYGSLSEFWNQGYGSEMLRTLIGYARQFDELDELIGIVNPENAGSIKVLSDQSFKFLHSAWEEKTQVSHYCLKL